MRRLLHIAAILCVLYGLLVGSLLLAMYQPPAVFSHVMSRMPGFAYLLLPFKPLWFVARRGQLKVGDVAPDFSLKTPDAKSSIQLSSFRGQKPVVLIFGSHT